MARFTAHAGSYENACNLIEALNSVGIEASITAGGVAIHVDQSNVDDAQRLCRGYKASFDPGLSAHQEDILWRSVSGRDLLQRVTSDAASIIQNSYEGNN